MFINFTFVDYPNLEKKIKSLVQELKDKLGVREVIAVVYNPKSSEGMKHQDCNFLKILFEKTNYVYPVFLLSGHGGDFSPGILFPYLIKESVNNYKVYIPRVCGSALCYTIFKANELLIGEKSEITQIDPKFEYEGEELRAIKHIRSTNDNLKKIAREVFDVAQDYVKKMCYPPSVFKFKIMDPNEFQHMNFIATYFMNKDNHETAITFKELEEMEVNIRKITDFDTEKIADELVFSCQDFTIQNDVRVIFVSSIPFYLKEDDEACFICPLK